MIHEQLVACWKQRQGLLQSTFTVRSWFMVYNFVTLDCEEWESSVFPAMALIEVSKTGALINFSSGEAPFLEVQWPSKVCSVLLSLLQLYGSTLLHKLFHSAASPKCQAVFVHTRCPLIQMMSHMFVELNAKQFSTRYSPGSSTYLTLKHLF